MYVRFSFLCRFLHYILVYLLTLNSMVNPFLYLAFNANLFELLTRPTFLLNFLGSNFGAFLENLSYIFSLPILTLHSCFFYWLWIHRWIHFCTWLSMPICLNYWRDIFAYLFRVKFCGIFRKLVLYLFSFQIHVLHSCFIYWIWIQWWIHFCTWLSMPTCLNH
jgi:hypothetical protein